MQKIAVLKSNLNIIACSIRPLLLNNLEIGIAGHVNELVFVKDSSSSAFNDCVGPEYELKLRLCF